MRIQQAAQAPGLVVLRKPFKATAAGLSVLLGKATIMKRRAPCTRLPLLKLLRGSRGRDAPIEPGSQLEIAEEALQRIHAGTLPWPDPPLGLFRACPYCTGGTKYPTPHAPFMSALTPSTTSPTLLSTMTCWSLKKNGVQECRHWHFERRMETIKEV